MEGKPGWSITHAWGATLWPFFKQKYILEVRWRDFFNNGIMENKAYCYRPRELFTCRCQLINCKSIVNTRYNIFEPVKKDFSVLANFIPSYFVIRSVFSHPTVKILTEPVYKEWTAKQFISVSSWSYEGDPFSVPVIPTHFLWDVLHRSGDLDAARLQ